MFELSRSSDGEMAIRITPALHLSSPIDASPVGGTENAKTGEIAAIKSRTKSGSQRRWIPENLFVRDEAFDIFTTYLFEVRKGNYQEETDERYRRQHI